MILILTAGFGDGHNTAARNVAAGLMRLAPENKLKVIDVCDAAHPVVTPLNEAGYQLVITHAPWIWQYIYNQAGKVRFTSGEPGMFFGLQRALDEILKREKPTAIVLTYLVYSGLLENLRKLGRKVPPVFTVVTDSISVHPAWMLGPSDRYFVADEDTKHSLAALGAKAEDIVVSGFPVSLDFMEPPPVSSNGNPGRIIYLPSTNVKHAARTLEALRPLVAQGAQLTLPLGKHKSRLYHTVTSYVDSLPGANIQSLGWTNQIPRLLQTHDLAICKAGGAILHEALAATCGTAVVWTKCDRIPYRRLGMLVRHLVHELGRIFRRFLYAGLTLRVNGEQVPPTDILRRDGFPDLSGVPILFPPLEFVFAADTSPTGSATVSAEFSLLPVLDWASLPNDVKRARGISASRNVSILRAQREIAFGWYLMGEKRRENYDSWWRCEICFDPHLDDLFGVAHNKQGIRPTQALVEAVMPSLEAQARLLNREVRQMFTSIRPASQSSTEIAARKDHGFAPRPQTTLDGFKAISKRRLGIRRYVLRARPSDKPAFLVSYARAGGVHVDLNSHHPIYQCFYLPLAKIAPALATRFELLLLALARVLVGSDVKEAKRLKALVETWSDAAAVMLDGDR